MRPALEQAVGEAAGGSAHVETVRPGRVAPEQGGRVAELEAAARDVLRRFVDRHRGVVRHHLPGFLRAGAGLAEPHFPGQHGRGRPRTRLEEAALHEERVEPDLRHGRSVAVERLCGALGTSPRYVRRRTHGFHLDPYLGLRDAVTGVSRVPHLGYTLPNNFSQTQYAQTYSSHGSARQNGGPLCLRGPFSGTAGAAWRPGSERL